MGCHRKDCRRSGKSAKGGGQGGRKRRISNEGNGWRQTVEEVHLKGGLKEEEWNG